MGADRSSDVLSSASGAFASKGTDGDADCEESAE